MNIVLLTHPQFLTSQSMPRFARMIFEGMRERKHNVSIWSSPPFFHRLPVHSKLRKWLGYIDQYLIFPMIVRWRMLSVPKGTIFVFADQALGPWVPLVTHKPHVVHVHDFLALRSSLGEIPQNPTSWTGKKYQAMIRRGFSRGKNFISVSENTKADLERFLATPPVRSEVVYNGLNYPFARMAKPQAVALLNSVGLKFGEQGFLLHVGGNQWYKNRAGVLEIYKSYAQQCDAPLPLVMIGEKPSASMTLLASQVTTPGDVVFLSGLNNDVVCAAYSCASLLIFPSLAEGFGWPIAEAMACGCLVLTTGEAPMTEVGGEAAFYIPANDHPACQDSWAEASATKVIQILNQPEQDSRERHALGLQQSEKFRSSDAICAYERIYLDVIESHTTKASNGMQ